jgi:hypothetical protein
MRKQKSRCRLVMLQAQNDSHMLCVASRVGASSASAAAASVRAKPYADTYDEPEQLSTSSLLRLLTKIEIFNTVCHGCRHCHKTAEKSWSKCKWSLHYHHIGTTG